MYIGGHKRYSVWCVVPIVAKYEYKVNAFVIIHGQ
jgi:hypothetical protein